MQLRARTTADLDECKRIARAVQALDRYPLYLPDDDFQRFLTRPAALAAFVAVDGAEVVGHVAVNESSHAAMMDVAASALSVPRSELNVVARLFVAPASRRGGVGQLLLDTAADDIRGRGAIPILDVWTGLPNAVALYERAGWRRLGEIMLTLPDGSRFPEIVFAAPE